MPHNTPQPFSVSGQAFPCVQLARQAGLLRRPSVTVFSEVFFSLMLGWGKSKLVPTAVVGSDQFSSHGVSITGEL